MYVINTIMIDRLDEVNIFCILCVDLQRVHCLSSPHAFTPSSALVRERQALMCSQFPHLSERESTTDRASSAFSLFPGVFLPFPTLHTLHTQSTPELFTHWTSTRSCDQFVRVLLKWFWKRQGSERGWSIFKSARISLRARATYVLSLKTRYSTSVCLKNAWKNVSLRTLKTLKEYLWAFEWIFCQ